MKTFIAAALSLAVLPSAIIGYAYMQTTQNMGCDEVGRVAQWHSLNGQNAVVVNIPGAKHEGEILTTPDIFAAGDSVKICQSSTGARVAKRM